MLSELSKYLSEVISMVLWVSKINEDIIEENQDEFVQVLTKEIVHHLHKLGRGVGYTKRHDQEFIESPPRLKCSFVDVFRFYWHLLIP